MKEIFHKTPKSLAAVFPSQWGLRGHRSEEETASDETVFIVFLKATLKIKLSFSAEATSFLCTVKPNIQLSLSLHLYVKCCLNQFICNNSD